MSYGDSINPELCERLLIPKCGKVRPKSDALIASCLARAPSGKFECRSANQASPNERIGAVEKTKGTFGAGAELVG